MGDAATAAGVVVALVLGVLGLLDAKRSRRLAQQANEGAEAANRLAADAVRQAVEANQIAEHANELSEDANSVSKRSAAQQEEDWFVEWSAEWNQELNLLTLHQRGRDDALQATAVFTTRDLHRVYRAEDDVRPGGEFALALDEVGQQRVQAYVSNRRTGEEMSRAGIIWVGGPFSVEAKFVVHWKTGLGFPQQQVIEKQLS